MLIQRILTGIVLIILVLAGIFYLPLALFAWGVMGIALIGAWEWAGLVGFSKLWAKIAYLVFSLVTFLFIGHIPTLWIFSLAALTWLLLLLSLIYRTTFARLWAVSFFARAGLGLWLLGLLTYSLVFIRAQSLGDYYLLVLLLWVWAADIGAFFVGRRWGKHKLAVEISPGKV